jgi:hypothetical protein
MGTRSTFDVKINIDLYIRLQAQAAPDAEAAVMQILTDKLLKSEIVYRIDPRVITTTLMEIPQEV